MWLTNNETQHSLEQKRLKSFEKSFGETTDIKLVRQFGFILILLLVFLLLPWTQNIKSGGKVTTLRPEQRPQELNALIAGRIEKWYVKEGDIVKAGDTILRISEIKSEYLDPALIDRTEEQIQSKIDANNLYDNKAEALMHQIAALEQARALKIEQLKNKVKQAQLYIVSDSMAMQAAGNQLNIAKEQFKRQKELYDAGLKSLTELEQRNQALQDANARKTIAENKYYNTKNDLLNAMIELQSTNRDYEEKIAKAEAERFQSLSQVSSGYAEVAKLENQYSNYKIRNGFYLITAPQDGQITKTVKAGIGESVKEGDLLVQITPNNIDIAVEIYVSPNDLPLIHKGEKVRLQFDGFPAIVFTGWPNASYGTFGGIITAVDNNISVGGKFRILVAEDKAEKPWPKNLRLGGGVEGMALLKDVPIWYELWRNINGFPADYYGGKEDDKTKTKKSNDEK
jgi:adhesin transport system membrane fusion protein